MTNELEALPWTPGVLKWYDWKKGYGFVRVEAEIRDIFIHAETFNRCGFRGTLKEGDKLEIKYTETPKRNQLIATAVQPVLK